MITFGQAEKLALLAAVLLPVGTALIAGSALGWMGGLGGLLAGAAIGIYGYLGAGP